MDAPSILFPPGFDRTIEPVAQPEFFVDLALDRIVAAVTTGREEYDLKPFFYRPLSDAGAIAFRHAVLRDLEDPSLFANLKAFAESLRTLRKHLAFREKLHYPRQQERWFLEAVDVYGKAVARLVGDLSRAQLASLGLAAWKEWLSGFTASEEFVQSLEHTRHLKAGLATLRYCVKIDGLLVQVRDYAGESDYSAEIEATFERFKSGARQDYPFEYTDFPDMNHVEAKVLDLVAELHPQLFDDLTRFCREQRDFLPPAIARFDREIQFYIAYLEFVAPLQGAGLRFCYPHIAEADQEVSSHQGFDLALAVKLVGEESIPVCNDFHLAGPERIIVVSGPNQGGKTTFARTFGQLHYLGSLGLTVPGEAARLYRYDRLFTHFEREEQMTNLRGKLQDDLVRIHAILADATPRSIVLINEIFASTTYRDASVLSRAIMEKLFRLGLLAVWVTFLDELSTLGDATVSMVSTVDPENPAVRTFRIVRRPSDGLAYALSIAEKYRLTAERIKERLNR